MATSNPILEQARKEQNAEVATTAIPATSSAPEPTETPKTSAQLKDTQEALAASSARIGSSIKSLEASTAKTQTATDVITSSISDVTAAIQITNRAKDVANLQAQNATINAFAASGGADEQAIIMGRLQDDNDRVATMLDEKQDIANDTHTGIQLIDGVINEFRSVQVDLNIEAAQAQLAQTERQIQNTGAATESFARTNALTKKTLNEGVIEANYKAIEAEGKIKGAQAELANINTNAAAMARLTVADQRNVANLIQSFRLEGEAEERELKKERQVFAREQMKFQREKWEIDMPAAQVALDRSRIALEDTKGLTTDRRLALEANFKAATKDFNDQVATEDVMTEAVMKGQGVAGTTIEDKDTIRWGLFKSPAAVRAKYVRLQELGGTEDPVLGQTPFEAKESLSIVAPSGNITETPATLLLDQVTNLQVEKYKKDGLPKDDAAIRTDFNATAQLLTETAATNIAEGDATNPYQAPPMSVLATKAAVAESTLYKRVLAPLAMKETSPQRIMDAAVAGIRAGNVSPEEAAAGIEVIFDAAAAHNNTDSGGFRRVGLPNQLTYNTSLFRPLTAFEQLKGKTSIISAADPIDALKILTLGPDKNLAKAFSGLTKTFIVDLMNGTEVQQAITRLLSSAAPTVKTPIANTETEE